MSTHHSLHMGDACCSDVVSDDDRAPSCVYLAVNEVYDVVEGITQVTDTVAFALGALFTSIPAIKWFCYYAVICVAFDFLYKKMFFIALMVLDLRRQETGRCDCLICLCVSALQQDDEPNENPETAQNADSAIEEAPKVETLQRRMMRGYAKFLLKPWVKVVVLVSFFSFFVGMAISALTAKIGFDITDFLSDDINARSKARRIKRRH